MFSNLTTRRIVAILSLLTAGIVVVHVTTLVFMWGFGHDNLYGLTALFDVDGEDNIPAFFSFSIMMYAVALIGFIALHHRSSERPRTAYWVGLATVFTFLAIDEGFEVHERIAITAAGWIGAHELSVYAWLVPYGIGGIAFLLIYTRFLRQLPRPDALRILRAGMVYVAGAGVAECIGALLVHIYHTEHVLGYDIETACEESLEMVGVILFIYALLKYIDVHVTASNAVSDEAAKKKRPGTEVPGRDDSAWSRGHKSTSA
ncbi:MAG TPA: hypothetical protein VJS69_11725 [Candidatus Krumholzibacteria bacterium]|nr:hypothetical protein [Candidatus Krumholzibacteria bacterium]